MSCKLSIGEFARRLQMRTYQGLPAGNVGSTNNFAYVVSDTVPANKFWLVLFAQAICDGSGGSDPLANNLGLYLLNPSAKVPPNVIGKNGGQNNYAQQPIFLCHKGGAPFLSAYCNAGPLDPTMAIKIDDTISMDTVPPTGIATPYTESFLRGRKYLIVPEGHTLLVTNWFNANTGGQLAAQLSLSIQFAELAQGEDVDL